MRKPIFTLIIATALLAATQMASAQDSQPKLEDVPAPPPIPAGVTEEDFEPQVTIVKRGDDVVEEYRAHGKLYMVKVTPPHGTPYYLIDRRGDGTFEHIAGEKPLSVPMWVIKSW
ncbi:DUF2782 domain-containing protein [Denitromonas iodatirespirans]|uniref:DUF2782 domain-containing protein n=1 Tax=Denitromonas iodatirespirans TaxID=2795389 RepID=A0A944DAL3_DENI1|nr:DUF2782 domain-containing protein [Denitromonas iodatirespirans]MBT0961812.1 DUF2782 domain-containing protein [Denitromonas iodatirespirans]